MWPKKKIKQNHTAQNLKKKRERERRGGNNSEKTQGEYGDSEAKQTKYF